MTSGIEGRSIGDRRASGSFDVARCLWFTRSKVHDMQVLLEDPAPLNDASANIIYAVLRAESTPETRGDAAVDDASTIYSRSGIGERVGFGARPAVVFVDLQRGFTDPASPVGDDLSAASSAFFGTPLHTFLVAAGVDTLVVAGCVTSGCIRATVVNAVSWG